MIHLSALTVQNVVGVATARSARNVCTVRIGEVASALAR